MRLVVVVPAPAGGVGLFQPDGVPGILDMSFAEDDVFPVVVAWGQFREQVDGEEISIDGFWFGVHFC